MTTHAKWWAAPDGDALPYCVVLGQMLRQLRLHAGKTQIDVARTHGVLRNQMSRYESGEAKPSISLVVTFCGEYDANPVEFFARVAVASRDATARAELGPLPVDRRFIEMIVQYDRALPRRRAVERTRRRHALARV